MQLKNSCPFQRSSKYITQEDTGKVQNDERKRPFENKRHTFEKHISSDFQMIHYYFSVFLKCQFP